MKRARLWLAMLTVAGLGSMVIQTEDSNAGEDKAVKYVLPDGAEHRLDLAGGRAGHVSGRSSTAA